MYRLYCMSQCACHLSQSQKKRVIVFYLADMIFVDQASDVTVTGQVCILYHGSLCVGVYPHTHTYIWRSLKWLNTCRVFSLLNICSNGVPCVLAASDDL